MIATCVLLVAPVFRNRLRDLDVIVGIMTSMR
jgi:hypothetical protein